MDTLKGEVEVLTNIYFDADIQVHEDNDRFTVNVLILPNTAPQPSTINNVAVTLTVSVNKTSNYPLSSPDNVQIIGKKNIDPMRQRTLDNIAKEVLEANQGFEVLFDLFSRIQQWLAENNTCQVRSVYDELAVNKICDQAEDEQLEESIHLTDSNESDDDDQSQDHVEEAPPLQTKDLVPDDLRVTEEQFIGWAQQFKKEMIGIGKWQDINKGSDKPTGKQFFLNGMSADEGKFASVIEGTGSYPSVAVSPPPGSNALFWRDKNLYNVNDDDSDVNLSDLSDD